MAYADCFVLPVPKKNLAAYKKMATAASKVWIEHGALEYRECVGEDLTPKMPGGAFVRFGVMSGAKRGEVVVCSWIVYKDRKHRDRVNARVMKDKRLAEMCGTGPMPFDVKRMAYGGFEVMVEG